ncbi:pyridoxal phosphate homeostasis protein-like isoform X1 [Triticum dicoccoides]|uniref:pyridoxal phosphate homeostasis protein-like isoform X1 n=1 Tax=Triticum dicoccoides TaxID=85692 RepID=UPI00188E8353|nr:pyridoxal phosphate homeostasis protein-like isoform X1 [Triticum dicoccoides]
MRAVLARPGSAAEQSRRAAEAVRVVAIGKTKLVSLLRQLYDAGHRCFGENYVQEFVTKAPQLPEDIRWHFVGHLQSNKVKSLVGLLFFAITPHLTPRIISGHSSSAAATQLAPMTPCMEQVKELRKVPRRCWTKAWRHCKLKSTYLQMLEAGPVSRGLEVALIGVFMKR